VELKVLLSDDSTTAATHRGEEAGFGVGRTMKSGRGGSDRRSEEASKKTPPRKCLRVNGLGKGKDPTWKA